MGVYNFKPLHEGFSEEQARERIEAYFDLCVKEGMRPGVEGLAMAFKVSSRTLHNWKNGIYRKELQNVITEAFQFIAAYLETVSLSGKLNPATSCFLFKNWLGYKDTVTNEFVEKPSAWGCEFTNEQIESLIED